MAEEIMVEPINAAAPVEATTPAPAEETSKTPGLSDELLKIPAVQALFAGQPAAISATLKDFEKRGEAKTIASHRDQLMKAGMGFYRTLDGARGVVFNSLYVSPDQIKAADQSGELAAIAPEFDEVDAATAKSGEANPVLTATPPTGLAAGPMPGSNAQAVMPKPQPASAQKALANQRSKNLQQGPPTSGPAPGQGRLLGDLLKPVL